MTSAGYAILQDVIMDADFPDLDLALRRGRHVDRDDIAWYTLLSDAQALLEAHYRRYGCELIHKTDGYFYLLPTGDKVSRKQLGVAEMVVGQALALLYLDPAMLDRGGVVTQEDLITQLATVLGNDALIATFNPGTRKRLDERIAQRNVRKRAAEAARKLASLGFLELGSDGNMRLRAALMRFAEPVRGQSEPAEMLAKLVQQGEVALAPDDVLEEDEPLDEQRVDEQRDPQQDDELEDEQQPQSDLAEADNDEADNDNEPSSVTAKAPASAADVAPSTPTETSDAPLDPPAREDAAAEDRE